MVNKEVASAGRTPVSGSTENGESTSWMRSEGTSLESLQSAPNTWHCGFTTSQRNCRSKSLKQIITLADKVSKYFRYESSSVTGDNDDICYNHTYKSYLHGAIIIYLLRQMAAHIKYTNQYTKKHTIHSIKGDYKLGLQFIHCYEKIAVSTKCRHKLRFSSATPEHRL